MKQNQKYAADLKFTKFETKIIIIIQVGSKRKGNDLEAPIAKKRKFEVGFGPEMTSQRCLMTVGRPQPLTCCLIAHQCCILSLNDSEKFIFELCTKNSPITLVSLGFYRKQCTQKYIKFIINQASQSIALRWCQKMSNDIFPGLVSKFKNLSAS